MTMLSNDVTGMPSHADATDGVLFDKQLVFCLGLIVLATLLVILSMFAGPTLVNLDVPPIGP
jgi:hypothetical protein